MFSSLLILGMLLLTASNSTMDDEEDFSHRDNSMKDHQFYKLSPQKLGAKVYGMNLSSDPSPELIKQIIRDVYKYKLLVFKDQGKITAKRQVDIAYWFGDHIDTQHRIHEKAEHPAVFRVSNDESEGYTNVGNKGWHIDGFFSQHPHTFVLYHMPSVPQKGHTAFVDLGGVVDQLNPEEKSVWQRLYIRCKYQINLVHPLVYKHPVTRNQTICINTQFVMKLILDHNTSQALTLNDTETQQFIEEMENKFNANHYAHTWEEGDFLMTDNLALAHIATSDTQLPREEIGLRVLHRVSIAGSMPPLKDPPPLQPPLNAKDRVTDEL